MDNITATILQDAETLIKEDGWIQGTGVMTNLEGNIIGRCAEIAIRTAACMLTYDYKDIAKAETEAYRLLAYVVKDPDSKVGRTDNETINHWNDKRAQDVNEVTAALAEARKPGLGRRATIESALIDLRDHVNMAIISKMGEDAPHGAGWYWREMDHHPVEESIGPFDSWDEAQENLVQDMTALMIRDDDWPDDVPMEDIIEFAIENRWNVVPLID